MLEKYMNTEFFRENVNTCCALEHRVEDRDYWDRFKGKFFDELKENNELHEAAFKILPASKHILFKKEGNRIAFENPYFIRRTELGRLFCMEAIENEGNYFNDILDLFWAVMEETVWALPAHQKYSNTDDCMPHETETVLALFVGETAAFMTAIYYTFKNKFDEISPEIGARLKRRVKREVYENFLNNDYLWMGFGRIPNNWNPWITSNVVKCIINLGEYGEIEYKTLARSVYIINKYYSHYPEDGGCDEGVSYWAHAGGCFVMYAGCMKVLTDGKLDLTKEEKVKNMARFSVNMYNCKDYVVSFSDCGAKTQGNWQFIYHVGKIMDDDMLKAYAKANFEQTEGEKAGANIRSDWTRILHKAEALAELPDVKGEFELPKGSHFDSIKVMIERELTKEPFGLVLSAKANHNKESHNHLDTGTFMVFKNSVPFLVDAGNKTYTAQTFSDRRYELWNTRSAYHNLPIIGGAEQKPGREFESENVVFENSSMKADLQKAYGEDFINRFTREVGLDRENSQVVLKDFIHLTEEKEVEFIFMTPAEVEISDKILLSKEGQAMEISINKPYAATVEKVDDDDPCVVSNWGNNLKRIKVKMKIKCGEVTFNFR